MKKIILLMGVMLLAITFSGCGKKENVEQNKNVIEENDNQKNSNAGISGSDSENEGGIINSIKDAISSNKKLKCTYTSNEDGLNMEMITYMQGEKYKTEFAMEGRKNYSVFDGKISHSWEEGSGKGMRINMDCLDELSEGVDTEAIEEDEPLDESEEDIMKTFNKAMDIDCQEVGSIDFSIPENIEFVDQCEMLKQQQKMMENFNGGQVPQGMPQF